MSTDALKLTRQLLAIETTNPPGREDAAIDLLEAILRHAGFSLERHRFDDGRSNLVARISGRQPGPALAFTGHLDTVPLGDTAWTRNPLGELGQDGRIYGRGSSDMKGGVAAFVTAAVQAAREGDIATDLVLVLTAGEERGCEGVAAMRRDGVRLPEIGAWVVAEPTANRLSLGHKGALFLKLEFAGRTAHSAMPQLGDNAVYRAAHAVLDIRDLDLPHEEHKVLGRANRNVGLIQGGHAVNAVPDRAELTMDIRSVPGMRHDALIDAIRAITGDRTTISVLYDLPPVWTDEADTFVARCRAALWVHGQDDLAPIGMPFFTDAAILAEMAPAPVVIMGPGEPAQAHRTDEWCSVAEIERSAAIYRTLISS
ncbi:M20 family metallopeptidase [Mesorhizobium sp. SP-1A]|uniref:M20 family metallopeptidase n=1 Tax=Mesorhizobium sp. SP-1A TaxID=3077840 RepID=UPI0028F71029|nr:M20 family metallopeptidase [Mesorhizobium sp. SP-1A]